MSKGISIPITFEAEGIKFGALNSKNICHYSATARTLKGSQHTKALKFLAEDCIQYLKESKTFSCEPLEGYNSTTYHLTPTGLDMFGSQEFECSCQFFQTHKKLGNTRNCSHILALMLYFRCGRKRFKSDTNISGKGEKRHDKNC